LESEKRCLKRIFTCKRNQDCLGKSEEASESNGVPKPEQNESSSEEEDSVLKLLNEKLQSIQSDKDQETMSNQQCLLMIKQKDDKENVAPDRTKGRENFNHQQKWSQKQQNNFKIF